MTVCGDSAWKLGGRCRWHEEVESGGDWCEGGVNHEGRQQGGSDVCNTCDM